MTNKIYILMSCSCSGAEDGKRKTAEELKLYLSGHKIESEIIALPYCRDSKFDCMDSILIWRLLHLNSDKFIALDILAGTVCSRNGIIWLSGEDDPIQRCSEIDESEWKKIYDKIIEGCSDKKILSSVQNASFYSELFKREITGLDMNEANLRKVIENEDSIFDAFTSK